MGKSIRSKVMKRFRSCKREVIAATTDLERVKAANQKCMLIAAGIHTETKATLNAFRYPKQIDADIPQSIIHKPVDFRSAALPSAGYAVARNSRPKKKTGSTVVVSTTTLIDQMEL